MVAILTSSPLRINADSLEVNVNTERSDLQGTHPSMGASGASAVPWRMIEPPVVAGVRASIGGPQGPWAGVHLSPSPNSGSESLVDFGGVSNGTQFVKEEHGLVSASVLNARRQYGAKRHSTS
jgi:hypothetical protein